MARRDSKGNELSCLWCSHGVCVSRSWYQPNPSSKLASEVWIYTLKSNSQPESEATVIVHCYTTRSWSLRTLLARHRICCSYLGRKQSEAQSSGVGPLMARAFSAFYSLLAQNPFQTITLRATLLCGTKSVNTYRLPIGPLYVSWW